MRLHDIAKSSSGKAKIIPENELKKLHSVLLVILDDLITISEENDLKFVMIGGSAIGALRHKGFIPWDDDIDIAMPRRDFVKLQKIIKRDYKNKYSMLDPQSKKNYGRVIPKIRLKGTEYRTILESDLDDCGIFIDIYPIENIPDHKIIKLIQGIMCLGLGFALSCKRLYDKRAEYKEVKSEISMKLKCTAGFVLGFVRIEKWAKWTDKWHSICHDEKSEYVGTPADDRHYFGEIYKRSDMCRYVKAEFEGRKVLLPYFYDKYLGGRYGNYMDMPPENKRVRNAYINLNFGKYSD